MATNSNNGAMLAISKTMDFISNNMEAVVGIGGEMVGLFGTLKVLPLGASLYIKIPKLKEIKGLIPIAW